MSFELIVNLDCPVKDALTSETLVDLIKARNQAGAILAMVRGKGDTRPPSQINITRRLMTPEGTRDKSVNIQAMLDEGAKLDAHAHHCVDCPANAAGRPFGCYWSIAYPFKLDTERWLMALLPDSVESTAGQFLVRSLKGLHFDGKPIAVMRAKDTFFESKTPVTRTWGSWLSKTKVTSDQVLQMMCCLDLMEPSHSLMLALILGLIPHDLTPDEFGAALDLDVRRKRLAQARIPEGDNNKGQVDDMRIFLKAIVSAAALDRTLGTSH